MQFEIREIIAIAGLVVAGLAAFFNLRGRVGVIEARQKDDREAVKEGYKRIENSLTRIEEKLDGKADK